MISLSTLQLHYGLQSPVDVLTFEGREQLSTPFRYDIQFTSTDKAIAPESVLMQDNTPFSLTAPYQYRNAGAAFLSPPARRQHQLLNTSHNAWDEARYSAP